MSSQKEDLKSSRRKRLNWIIVLGLVVIVTVLSLPSTEYFELNRLKKGEQSPVTYRVDQQYRVRDKLKRKNKIRNKLSSITPNFYEFSEKKSNLSKTLYRELEKLKETKSPIEGISEYPDSESEWGKLRNVVESLSDYFLTQGIIEEKSYFDYFKHQEMGNFVRINDDERTNAETIELNTLKTRFISMSRIEDHASGMIRSLYPQYNHKELVLKLLSENLSPTISFDKEGFLEEVEEARRSVEPFFITYREGDIVLQEGEVVTKTHLNILSTINDQKIRFQFIEGLGGLGIIVTALVFIFFYLQEFEPELFSQPNKLALMSVLVIIFLTIAKAVKLLLPGLPPGVEFALPFAAPIMLIALMVSESMAFVTTLFLSLIFISYFGFSIELLAMCILGGLTGILSIRRVDRRLTLLQGGLLLGAVQSVVVFFFYGVRTQTFLSTELGTIMVWAGINGVIFTPFMTLGILPFLENGFGITTNFRLLELADLNHPLLQELFQEAPGTFQHSIMLSNLCEQAARSIGANALLVRVGAYYHDLGKAETPDYFIENQSDQENPHDELKPTLSASILKAHVKKGSDKAREYGLPEEIIDLIEQHHGTTLMKSFYHSALTGEDNVTKEEFQYPGPLPQTKEAGICMLGDAVEAATRALENPTPQKIKERTTELVHQKFADGQLNECDLTLKDLDVIIETFTKVLTSVYHRRIQYPDDDETEKLEKEQDGNESE